MNDKYDLQSLSRFSAELRKHRVSFQVASGATEAYLLVDGIKLLPLEELLKFLRQEVESLLSVVGVGSIGEVFNAEIPDKIVDDVRERLWQVYCILACVECQLKETVLLENLMQTWSEMVDYYKKECEPYKNSISQFFVSLFPPEDREKIIGHSIGDFLGRLSKDEIGRIIGRDPSVPANRNITTEELQKLYKKALEKNKKAIKNTFEISISLLQENYENADSIFLQGYDREISKSDYVDAKNLIVSDYFKPDSWIENIDELGPIFSPRKREKFPTHIRCRMDEMYFSFIFGNWMSVVALGRSLLEYIIIDRRSSLGIEVYEKDSDGRERPWRISRLVDLACGTADAKFFEDDMRAIIEYGNGVMHPEKTRKVRVLPVNRADALDCLKKVVKIIQVLYKSGK